MPTIQHNCFVNLSTIKYDYCIIYRRSTIQYAYYIKICLPSNTIFSVKSVRACGILARVC